MCARSQTSGLINGSNRRTSSGSSWSVSASVRSRAVVSWDARFAAKASVRSVKRCLRSLGGGQQGGDRAAPSGRGQDGVAGTAAVVDEFGQGGHVGSEHRRDGVERRGQAADGGPAE